MHKFLPLFIIISLFYYCNLKAQGIGIGNPTPAASALIDLTSTDKGLLVPRIALTATNVTTPVTAPATSLLVFNTATAGTTPNNVTPGYYFWNGAKWVRLKSSADNTEWGTTGNAGSNTTINYIGTTDAQDLSFRVNNIEKMKLFKNGRLELYGDAADSSIIYIGKNAGVNNTGANAVFIGKETGLNNTGNANTFLGHKAGRANTTGFENLFTGFTTGDANTTGSENTFIGNGAGGSNTTGNRNTFVGNSAGAANTTASNNTLVGSDVGSSSNGSNNSFFGNRAGSGNTTGSSNTFLGNDVAFFNTTGSFNTFVGESVGFINNLGSNNIAIGSGATFIVQNLNNASAIGTLARADASNSIVLGAVAGFNTATTSAKVGIGTNAPNSRLHVIGSVGTAVTTTITNLTLDETHHTVLIIGTPTITLPSPGSCLGRMYVIINQTGTPRTISSYFDFTNNATTLIGSSLSITLQSTGGNWSRVQ